ncbi:glycoside hydrolase family 26 protein [uncultured Cellulomonas sp.]|uniref:glycoside hydrolase family 26 protein n=1 Tax=uncultured Cellulomonas sp. TaxID=189682 RepID=UPI0026079921|nr:glycosyl hydrolase [uncultured Cellulomonas sp.]
MLPLNPPSPNAWSPARAVPSAALVLAGVLALAGCSTFAAATPAPPRAPVCAVPRAADVVPPDGILLGVNLDWGRQTLAEYAGAIGRGPAVAVHFSDVPLSPADVTDVVAAGEQVRADGGVLLLTLEPTDGLAAVTPDVVDDVVDLLSSINRTGVPVVLRFAHEMNGSWYTWGQQPAAFVATFRALAVAVRAGAPGTAMMWAPNYGGGYPFTGGPSAAVAGSADHAALDSDGDGVLTLADDPYAPYYPGDDVVDWVGMSLYHWGSAHPWGENELPEPGKFAAQLTGTYVGDGGDDTALPDFYSVYGVEHGKPVAVPETAALVVPGDDLTAPAELAIKQAWWRQVLSPQTAEQFPQLRMVNWFEWDKHEPEIGATVRWSVAGDPVTRDAFVADLPAWARFAEPPAPCRVADDA